LKERKKREKGKVLCEIAFFLQSSESTIQSSLVWRILERKEKKRKKEEGREEKNSYNSGDPFFLFSRGEVETDAEAESWRKKEKRRGKEKG